MSTYLVAFIVSDFGHLELSDAQKTQYDYNFRGGFWLILQFYLLY